MNQQKVGIVVKVYTHSSLTLTSVKSKFFNFILISSVYAHIYIYIFLFNAYFGNALLLLLLLFFICFGSANICFPAIPIKLLEIEIETASSLINNYKSNI